MGMATSDVSNSTVDGREFRGFESSEQCDDPRKRGQTSLASCLVGLRGSIEPTPSSKVGALSEMSKVSKMSNVARPQVYWINQYCVTPDQPGGTRHFDMGRELVREGMAVSLFASDLSLSSRSYSRRTSSWSLRSVEEIHDGVKFVWLPAGSYEKNNWKRLFSALVFSVAVFVRLLRVSTTSATLFIGSSPHVFGAFVTCLASRARRVPFVFEVRDLWPESYEEVTGVRSGPLVRAMRWMVDDMYRRAASIVVLAPANADAIVERGISEDKIRCIPNGVDLADFDEPQDRRSDGTVRFVYAGAHGPANGLEVVVDACVELTARGVQGWEVTLVGDGPRKAALVRDASDRRVEGLKFWDPISKEAIPSLLATFDVGLMILAPAEVFASGVSPNKLFDYLAANLPVVNNVPGLVEGFITEARSGLTCAPGDARALADGMVAMMAEIRIGSQVYRNGRQYVTRHFDRRSLAGELAEILGQITSQSTR